MTLEYYREMYVYYKTRCCRLETLLKSTESSIQDVLRESKPFNEIEEWDGDDSSHRSGYTTSSTSSNAPMDVEDEIPNFEPGAGSMWLEEFNQQQDPGKKQTKEDCQSMDSCSDTSSTPSCIVDTEDIRSTVKAWVQKVCEEVSVVKK